MEHWTQSQKGQAPLLCLDISQPCKYPGAQKQGWLPPFSEPSLLTEKTAPALQFPVAIEWADGCVNASKPRKCQALTRCLTIVRGWGEYWVRAAGM